MEGKTKLDAPTKDEHPDDKGEHEQQQQQVKQ